MTATEEVEDFVDEPKPTRVSATQLDLFKQCKRRWVWRYVDKNYGESTAAMVTGTFVHSVLEGLYEHPKDERTVDTAKVIARTNWDILEGDPEFVQFELSEEEKKAFRVNAWKLIQRLWELERPTMVNVIDVEKKVEFEVVPGIVMVGFIDRLSQDKGGNIEIVDYKTGKRPPKWYEADKVEQIMLYGLAVTKLMDRPLGRGRLFYLGGESPGIINRGYSKKLIDEAEQRLIENSLGIAKTRIAAEAGEVIEPNPAPLCGWCDFFPFCGEGQEYVLGRLDKGDFRLDAPAVEMLNDPELQAAVKSLTGISRVEALALKAHREVAVELTETAD